VYWERALGGIFLPELRATLLVWNRNKNVSILGIIIGAAGLVVWSGSRLTHYGDVLGGKVGLSRTWVGVILFAMMTSLPELVVTLSAQLAVARPALVFGNVCGSNVFNLWIFALIAFYVGGAPLSTRAHPSLIRPLRMGILIMVLAFLGTTLQWIGDASRMIVLGWTFSTAILIIYVIAMKNTDRREGVSVASDESGEARPDNALASLSVRQITARFTAYGIILVAAGIGLILACDTLIGRPVQLGPITLHLGESVVGLILLAVVTSLPEMVVCLASARLGALDLALGNIFGSNIFNMVLLPLAHFIRPSQPFWNKATGVHSFALGMAILMSAVIMLGMEKRWDFRLLRLGGVGWLVAMLGAVTFVIIACHGG